MLVSALPASPAYTICPNISDANKSLNSLTEVAKSYSKEIFKKTLSDQFFNDNKPKFLVHQGDEFGWNVLCAAAYAGNVPLVTYFLAEIQKNNQEEKDQIKTVNFGNSYGMTPLICAAACEDQKAAYEISRQLIEAKADVNIATCSAYEDIPKHATAQWVASHKANTQIVELLSKHQATTNPSPVLKSQEN